MRATLAVLALTLGSAAALAATRVPRERTMHVSTQAGNELRVFTYTQFTRDCHPQDPPTIGIRDQPNHGTISVRPNPSTVTVLREGAPDCSGNTFPGTAVYYMPAPGFHGTDQFDYDILGHNKAHDTVIVDVR